MDNLSDFLGKSFLTYGFNVTDFNLVSSNLKNQDKTIKFTALSGVRKRFDDPSLDTNENQMLVEATTDLLTDSDDFIRLPTVKTLSEIMRLDQNIFTNDQRASLIQKIITLSNSDYDTAFHTTQEIRDLLPSPDIQLHNSDRFALVKSYLPSMLYDMAGNVSVVMGCMMALPDCGLTPGQRVELKSDVQDLQNKNKHGFYISSLKALTTASALEGTDYSYDVINSAFKSNEFNAIKEFANYDLNVYKLY